MRISDFEPRLLSEGCRPLVEFNPKGTITDTKLDRLRQPRRRCSFESECLGWVGYSRGGGPSLAKRIDVDVSGVHPVRP